MIELNYYRTDVSKEAGKKACEQLYSILPDLTSKYDFGGKDSVKNAEKAAVASIMAHLPTILDLLGDVRGKKILDLGCGSMPQRDGDFLGRQFEPWLCRGLHILGAHSIGIDIGKLEKELFEHYSLDLTKEGCLDFIKDHTIDLVTATFFFDSPSLHDSYGEAAHDLKQQLYPHIKRVLKPHSIFPRT